jgi:hypothetical protein
VISTKWPRLLVVGENVTEQQADEILIRTNEWGWLHGNDRAWSAAVEHVAGTYGRPGEVDKAPGEDHDAWVVRWRAQMDQMRAWEERIGVLQLSYLSNEQVMSSWIGGPHGWCNWAGEIGCSTYNLGKWPSEEAVTEDWTAIAAAFPFLDLTAQCVENEGDGALAAEWRVKDGRVEYNPEPQKQLRRIREASLFAVLLPGGERGVSTDRLRQAFATTVARREAATS